MGAGNLEGRVALVTGGGSGLGEATCRRFAAAGAFVAVVDRDEALAAGVVRSILAAGGQAAAYGVDATAGAAADAVVRDVAAAAGPVDLLVNNVGGYRSLRKIWEIDEAEWDAIVALNLKSVFLWTRAVAPGMVERLLPGEDVSFLTPSGSGPFAEFARHQLRAIATGFGLTYDLVTGDLSQANYSSLRAGRLAFKRRLEAAQWLLLVPQLCQPVWDAWVRAAQTDGALPLRDGPWPVEWAPPRFEMVDPLKDTTAIQQQLRLGLITWGQAVAEMGWDAERQAAEIARWNAAHDDAGLVFDGDARRVGKSGTAQDAAQLAAIEIGATGAALPQGGTNGN